MAPVSFRHPAVAPVRARSKRVKSKRGFVPRVIPGGKGAYLVGLRDIEAPRLMVKGATDAAQAALLYPEAAGPTLDGQQICVAVVDCETGLSHCFRLDFSEKTVAAA